MTAVRQRGTSRVRRSPPEAGLRSGLRLIGEELASAIAGTKSVDQALADAQRRVDELLGQVL
jgi:ABC-type glycerol-3-phosphate transport system substrate-binding protein